MASTQRISEYVWVGGWWGRRRWLVLWCLVKEHVVVVKSSDCSLYARSLGPAGVRMERRGQPLSSPSVPLLFALGTERRAAGKWQRDQREKGRERRGR